MLYMMCWVIVRDRLPSCCTRIKRLYSYSWERYKNKIKKSTLPKSVSLLKSIVHNASNCTQLLANPIYFFPPASSLRSKILSTIPHSNASCAPMKKSLSITLSISSKLFSTVKCRL
jgi:hypothetical protein